MEYVEVRSLTKGGLKEWLLKQGVPLEQVDAFHDADVDGDTLVELTEEHNAADFKDICPAIKQRVMLRRLLTGTTGHHEAGNAKPLPEDTKQQAKLATEETQTVSCTVKAEDLGKIKEALKTEQSPSIINLDDDDEPIPNPFKFPKFPRELQDSLVQGGPVPTKVIRDAAKYTAHALYSYSRHISKDDRERVAMELVQKFPKLKSSNRSRPYDQVAQDIRGHFKELNRKRPAQSLELGQPKAVKTEKQQTPQIKTEPDADSSEDEESYQQHVKSLGVQNSKSKPDKKTVSELMRLTFKRRRQEVETEDIHVDEVLKRHPFLQDFHEFYDEVERLIGPGTDQKFLEVVPKLIKYGKTIEESATVQSVSKQWDCKLEGFDTILALRYLAAMLANKKAKVDPDTLVREILDNNTAEELAETKLHKCPSILYNREQAFLAMDCKVLFSFPIPKAATVLLGCYYVFHVSYPREHTGLFTYLERVHGLKQTVKEVPKTVRTLETALRSA